MDEQTRTAAMKAFQIALMLGGSAAVSFGHADQGAVSTWTDSAMHAAPQFAGAVWLLANHYGVKVSDLFRRDDARVVALERSVQSLKAESEAFRAQVAAWMAAVEAGKTVEPR